MQRVLAESLDSDCYPLSFIQAGRAGTTDQLYSPGVCPDGYTSAQTNNAGATTTVVCCLRYGDPACTKGVFLLTSL